MTFTYRPRQISIRIQKQRFIVKYTPYGMRVKFITNVETKTNSRQKQHNMYENEM